MSEWVRGKRAGGRKKEGGRRKRGREGGSEGGKGEDIGKKENILQGIPSQEVIEMKYIYIQQNT